MVKSANDELVTAYFESWQKRTKVDDESHWAWEEVHSLCDRSSVSPLHGWGLVLKLIEFAPSREALDYVGAGPLEELLKYHGSMVIEQVKAEAEKNKQFLYALSSVWLSEDDVAYPEFRQLVEKYNLLEIDPIDGKPYKK